MLRIRITLGILLIAALVGAIWLDDALEGWAWGLGDGTAPPGVIAAIVVAFLSAMGSIELCAMYRAKGIASSRVLMVLAGWAGVTGCGFVPSEAMAVEAVGIAGATALLVLVAAIVFSASDVRPEGIAASTGATLLAFVYMGIALGFVLLLRREQPAWMLLWVLVTTKSCDIGAYFTGRLIGRTKLIEWLSPGKTWEVVIGGLVLSGIVGVVGSQWASELSVAWGLAVGVTLGAVGQLGDLLASLLKRDAGLKDSGRGVPGFGGWLDVLDSPLLAMPVAYWLLKVAM